MLLFVFSNYQEDFLLMCNNCMTYNPEDTVFYQAAKKLLSSGLKLIAKVYNDLFDCICDAFSPTGSC